MQINPDYIDYSVAIHHDNENDGEYEKILETMREMEIITGSIENGVFECRDISSYEWGNTMREISRMFPSVHLEWILNGSFACVAHFMNGKAQLCTPEFMIPPFDPKKLE